MEMHQIRYFLAICEHHNFTRAACACHVAQPSLTAAIQKLEAELGGPLFLRDRSGCRLTPLGALVRPRFERLVAEAREALAEAGRHVRLERVPITVGVGETIGHARLIHAVARFRERVPRADIELIVDGADALLAGLRAGRLDLAVVAMNASAELYRTDDLYSEGYCAVMPANHALAACADIPLSALPTVDLLDRPNCEMRDALLAACAAEGHALYAACRSNRVDWLLHLAAAGAGVVVLPETAVPADPRLVARPLAAPGLSRKVEAVTCRHQPRRPEAEALIREIRTTQARGMEAVRRQARTA